jgi:hypothetical protein
VTVKVNAWVAVPYLILAVRVSGYTRQLPSRESQIVAVPSLSAVILTPEGSRPVLVIVGAGSLEAPAVRCGADGLDVRAQDGDQFGRDRHAPGLCGGPVLEPAFVVCRVGVTPAPVDLWP